MILAGDRKKEIMDRNSTMDQGNLNDKLEVVCEIVAHFHQFMFISESKRAFSNRQSLLLAYRIPSLDSHVVCLFVQSRG